MIHVTNFPLKMSFTLLQDSLGGNSKTVMIGKLLSCMR